MASKADQGSRDERPVLIIVMGTSGSGKSTLGTKLAEALDVPFVDGDDLHPPENVAKMAAGHPLDDADRLPWLLKIREKAAELCANDSQESHRQAKALQVDERQRELAEVHETSKQGQLQPNDELKQDRLETAKEHAQQRDQDLLAQRQGQSSRGPREASQRRRRRPSVVIACSALKQHYRQILRHGVSEEDQVTRGSTQHVQPDLHVYHVYLRVSSEELHRRMHERKGHFMKESMLQSQLAALEEPVNEPDCFILDDGPVEELVAKGKAHFDALL